MKEFADLTARDVMSSDVITVPIDWPMDELAQFFTQERISGAPVVDEEGKLIGVVSLADIVRHDGLPERTAKRWKRHEYYLGDLENQLAAEEIMGLHVIENSDALVADIMTPVIFSVSENTSLKEIADKMLTGRIHRVFVVQEGRIIGIVTTTDMLRVIQQI